MPCDTSTASKRLVYNLSTSHTSTYFVTQLGIMHGDLKPQNVLVLERGGCKIKLCDFDSARDVRAGEPFPNNGVSLKFSREYVSPEVFRGRNVSAGSQLLRASLEIDLFALGLICALLLDSRLGMFILTTLLPVEYSDEEFEQYLFDQTYMNSILLCDEGYATTPMSLLSSYSHYSLIGCIIVVKFINFAVSNLVKEEVFMTCWHISIPRLTTRRKIVVLSRRTSTLSTLMTSL